MFIDRELSDLNPEEIGLINTPSSEFLHIFLDVDGVLNNTDYTIHRAILRGKGFMGTEIPFDDRCLEALSYLCYTLNKYDIKYRLILSSTWRLYPDHIKILEKELKKHNLNIFNKTGETAVGSTKRGIEISEYMEKHSVCKYLIIDDDVDILPSQKKYFLNTTTKNGLTMDLVEDILVKYIGIRYNWRDK